jgi:hypothetical protein
MRKHNPYRLNVSMERENSTRQGICNHSKGIDEKIQCHPQGNKEASQLYHTFDRDDSDKSQQGVCEMAEGRDEGEAETEKHINKGEFSSLWRSTTYSTKMTRQDSALIAGLKYLRADGILHSMPYRIIRQQNATAENTFL